MIWGIPITEETFDVVARKLQEELIDIIKNGKQINEYELIVYKYVFISELKVPLFEEMEIEIVDDGFVIHVIPDNLKLDELTKLNDVFDRFEIIFLPNSFNVIKLKFLLCD